MMIGNQRLQRQFDGLLMMGIVMPEMLSSVCMTEQLILRLIVASSWLPYSSEEVTVCDFSQACSVNF
jgi:hypothetical protein